MLNKDAKYIFNFCTRWNFTLAKMALERQKCMVRFCYVSTQKYRMYLVLDVKGLRYSPFVKGENQWAPVALEGRTPHPDADVLFFSLDTMESTMKEALFMQFPEAEVSFFDALPTSREVKATLERNPYGAELSKQFYLFTRFDDLEVGDADGVVDILVDEGVLSIPYTVAKPEWKNDFELQMYRALLHPDSKLAYAGQLFWEGIESLQSRLSSISWGSFRRLVDKTIQ